MSTNGFANLILVLFLLGSLYLINTNEVNSLMLLIGNQPNFEGWLFRSSVLAGSCLGDI